MRTVNINRETFETQIDLALNISNAYSAELNTPLGFLNHMLNTLFRYWDVEVTLNAQGDLEVDTHHTMEDIGIVLGKAIRELISQNKNIKRFADRTLVMEDALTLISIDLSGRSYLNYEVAIEREMIGNIPVEEFREFFRAFVANGGFNIQIINMRGMNAHHIFESIFKTLGLCLKEAFELNEGKVLSTKGSLEV